MVLGFFFSFITLAAMWLQLPYSLKWHPFSFCLLAKHVSGFLHSNSQDRESVDSPYFFVPKRHMSFSRLRNGLPGVVDSPTHQPAMAAGIKYGYLGLPYVFCTGCLQTGTVTICHTGTKPGWSTVCWSRPILACESQLLHFQELCKPFVHL